MWGKVGVEGCGRGVGGGCQWVRDQRERGRGDTEEGGQGGGAVKMGIRDQGQRRQVGGKPNQ